MASNLLAMDSDGIHPSSYFYFNSDGLLPFQQSRTPSWFFKVLSRVETLLTSRQQLQLNPQTALETL